MVIAFDHHIAFGAVEDVSNSDVKGSFSVGLQAANFKLQDFSILIFKFQMLDIWCFLVGIPNKILSNTWCK